MRKVVSFTNVSLDGVMQAPARPDEDNRDGFTRGGWATPYAAMQHAGGAMAGTGALLLGRRTYEDFYDVWPKRTDNPFTGILNRMQKYVASRTLTDALPWMNSTLLRGDGADAVAALKSEPGDDLLILGSGNLMQALRRRKLVDEYVVLIHPLLLGAGRRLFDDDGVFSTLRLLSSTTTPTGVVVARYAAAESPVGKIA